MTEQGYQEPTLRYEVLVEEPDEEDKNVENGEEDEEEDQQDVSGEEEADDGLEQGEMDIDVDDDVDDDVDEFELAYQHAAGHDASAHQPSGSVSVQEEMQAEENQAQTNPLPPLPPHPPHPQAPHPQTPARRKNNRIPTAQYKPKRPLKSSLKTPAEDALFASALSRVHAGEDRMAVATELAGMLPGRTAKRMKDKVRDAMQTGTWIRYEN